MFGTLIGVSGYIRIFGDFSGLHFFLVVYVLPLFVQSRLRMVVAGDLKWILFWFFFIFKLGGGRGAAAASIIKVFCNMSLIYLPRGRDDLLKGSSEFESVLK